MAPSVVILSCCDMRLESQGNGAFYTLRNGDKSVFFQGDDALTVESEYQALERAGHSTHDTLEWLCDTYGEVMQ